MKDPFGVRAWRSRPLRDRLFRPLVYVLMAIGSLALAAYLLSGGAGKEGGVRVVGLLCLSLAGAHAWLAFLSHRVGGRYGSWARRR